MNLDELRAWISANFWKSAQLTAWAERTFYRRKVHKQTRTGTGDSGQPIILNTSGYVDPSFYDLSAFTGAAQFTDNVFTLVDNGDTTKKVQFELSAIGTGVTRTITVPNADLVLVGRDLAQTLTNKTLTAPVISTISNTGTLTLPTSTDTLVGRATTDTLTNKTLTTPTISGTGFANANHNHSGSTSGGKLDTGALNDNAITTVKINDSAVTTAKISDDAVTNAKLANMAQDTIKGRASGAGTGDPTDLTATQARTILNVENGADVTDSTNVLSALDTVTSGALPGASDNILHWNSAHNTIYEDAVSNYVKTSGTQSIAGDKTFTGNVTVDGVLTPDSLAIFTGSYALAIFDSVTGGASTKIQVAISRATATTNIQGGQFDVRMTGRVGTTVKGGFTTISFNGRNSNTMQYVEMNTAGSMVVAVTAQTNTQLTLTFDLAPGGNWNEFSGAVLMLTPASSVWTITCTQVA